MNPHIKIYYVKLRFKDVLGKLELAGGWRSITVACESLDTSLRKFTFDMKDLKL